MELDLTIDAAAELQALLEDTGVDHRREGGRFSFVLTASGCKWQTVCECEGPRALFYFIHPARLTDEAGALRICSAVNSRLIRGSFFLREDHAVYRTGDELTELVEARERLCRAIEYGSSVMVWFWDQFCP